MTDGLTSLLGSAQRGARRRRKREERDARKNMLMAFGLQAFGAPIAQGLTKGIGDLINAPYRESINKFINNPQNANYRANVQTFQDAVSDHTSLTENMNSWMKKNGGTQADFFEDRAKTLYRQALIEGDVKTNRAALPGLADDENWNAYNGEYQDGLAAAIAAGKQAHKAYSTFDSRRKTWTFDDGLDNAANTLLDSTQEYSNEAKNFLDAKVWKPLGRWFSGDGPEDEANKTINSALLKHRLRPDVRQMFVLANQGNKEEQAKLDSLLNNFKTANAGVTKDQIGNAITTWLAEDQEASKYIEVSGAAAKAQFEANKASLSYGASLVTGTSSSNPDVANLQRKIAQQIATDKKIKITEVSADAVSNQLDDLWGMQAGESKEDLKELVRIAYSIEAFDPIISHAIKSELGTQWKGDIESLQIENVKDDVREKVDELLLNIFDHAKTQEARTVANLVSAKAVDGENRDYVIDVLTNTYGDTKALVKLNQEENILSRALYLAQKGLPTSKEQVAVETSHSSWLVDPEEMINPYTGNVQPVSGWTLNYNNNLYNYQPGNITREQWNDVVEEARDNPTLLTPNRDPAPTGDDTGTKTQDDITVIRKYATLVKPGTDILQHDWKAVVAAANQSENPILQSVVTNPSASIYSKKGDTTGAFESKGRPTMEIVNDGDVWNFKFKGGAVSWAANPDLVPKFEDIPEGTIKDDIRIAASEFNRLSEKYADNPSVLTKVIPGTRGQGGGRRADVSPENQELLNDQKIMKGIVASFDFPGPFDKARPLVEDFLASIPSGEAVPTPEVEAKDTRESLLGKQAPLSVRNNNPGNLKLMGQKGATEGEKGYAKFETPEQGLIALENQIRLDTIERGKTITEFVTKYAPPSDNNPTDKYIENVAKAAGVGPNDTITEDKIGIVARTIILQEGGQPALDYYYGT